MNVSEQAGVFNFLKTKGFNLEESTPQRLRFEKEGDPDSEIIITNTETELPVQINISGEISDYTATNFDDLMRYLDETIQ